MNRPRAKRILGMTAPQWLAIGVLLLCLCVTLGSGYWWLNLKVSKAYESPLLEMAGITPLPTHTAPPTATLVPTATVTPITYESLIPAGWERFSPVAASNVEIWMPEAYARQTEKDKKNSYKILEGEDDKTLETLLELKDTTPSSYLIFTSFIMERRSQQVNDLDAMIDQEFAILMREGRLLERGKFVFKTETYPARRLVFDINAGGVNAGIAVYIVQSGKDVYFLSFVTIFNELYVRLPSFDESVQTFKITPIIPTRTPTATIPAPTNTSLP